MLEKNSMICIGTFFDDTQTQIILEQTSNLKNFKFVKRS